MLFFTVVMKKLNLYLIALNLALFFLSCSEPYQTNPDEIRVALRSVGHQLLMSQQDSTSLVLPIETIDENNYRVKFENELSIEPDSLVNTVKRAFDKSSLASNYIIEVEKCSTEEVAYSYQIVESLETDIIPCKGRTLPKSCYELLVKFQKKDTGKNLLIWIIPIVILSFFSYYFLQRKKIDQSEIPITNEVTLGSFIFYPEQHKLVKQAKEISLSKKECEILEMFTEKPNEVISRDELTKRIWEDNGVIVGRSLDTYISKLRKKLKDDPNIKLINVHGIGYKLEIE